MILESKSVVDLLYIEQPVRSILWVIAIGVALAPYLAGADFGLVKIPKFPDTARKSLRISGPIAVVVCALLFIPFFKSDNAASKGSESGTATPQHITPSPSPPTAPANAPTPTPEEVESPTPTSSPTPTVTLILEAVTVISTAKTGGQWYGCFSLNDKQKRFGPFYMMSLPGTFPLDIRLRNMFAGQGMSVSIKLDENPADVCTKIAEHRDSRSLILRANGSIVDSKGMRAPFERDELRYELKWRVVR